MHVLFVLWPLMHYNLYIIRILEWSIIYMLKNKTTLILLILLILTLSACSFSIDENKVTAPDYPTNNNDDTSLIPTDDDVDEPSETPTHDDQEEDDERMLIHFIDVGQGDATLIQYKDKFILVDAGEPEYGPIVISYLESIGVEALWLVVATHPHADHIGGLVSVLYHFDVEYIIDSGFVATSNIYNAYMEAVMYNVNYHGTTLILDNEIGDLKFYFEEGNEEAIFYIVDSGDFTQIDNNESSVVNLLIFNEFSLLLTGDLESQGEQFLINRHYNEALEFSLEATIFKAAHHGSRTSNIYPFLDIVFPEYIVISAGINNRFGHPHQEVLERFAYYTDQVFITSEVCFKINVCAIVFETDGYDVFFDATPTQLPEVLIGDMIFVDFFEVAQVGTRLTITIQGQPHTEYSIDWFLPSGNKSGASSLNNQISDENGFITWTYNTTANTRTGIGTIVITDVESGHFIIQGYQFIS